MIWTAFILGLAGSLHCAAMCGPLIFSVQGKWGVKGINPEILLYHLFRVLGYVALGLGFSLVKIPIKLFNAQQYIALFSGIFLLLFVFKNKIKPLRWFFDGISKRLSIAMNMGQKTKFGLPILGFLNGLLPCGLSYATAAVSINQTGYANIALFMFFFGIGTLPLFLVGSFAAQKIKFQFFNRINQYMKYALVFTGCLLVLRGAGFGIPYLSPKVQQEKVSCCHK
ncbi:MAG: sulfite exporter TauE/SafE family protein [Flavobacteriales bacterium]|nr:sulfite exporter TauE/SafE family protein [Flavobacteriales bacterium]